MSKNLPSAEGVCAVLEEWSCQLELDALECSEESHRALVEFMCAAYRMCHVVRNPSCIGVHADWIKETHERIAGLHEAADTPNSDLARTEAVPEEQIREAKREDEP